MTYEEIARDVVKAWDNRYILDGDARTHESVLIRDIVSAISCERDRCVETVDKWIKILQKGSYQDIVEILFVIRGEISSLGSDNEQQAELPLL